MTMMKYISILKDFSTQSGKVTMETNNMISQWRREGHYIEIWGRKSNGYVLMEGTVVFHILSIYCLYTICKFILHYNQNKKRPPD